MVINTQVSSVKGFMLLQKQNFVRFWITLGFQRVCLFDQILVSNSLGLNSQKLQGFVDGLIDLSASCRTSSCPHHTEKNCFSRKCTHHKSNGSSEIMRPPLVELRKCSQHQSFAVELISPGSHLIFFTQTPELCGFPDVWLPRRSSRSLSRCFPSTFLLNVPPPLLEVRRFTFPRPHECWWRSDHEVTARRRKDPEFRSGQQFEFLYEDSEVKRRKRQSRLSSWWSPRRLSHVFYNICLFCLYFEKNKVFAMNVVPFVFYF